MRRGILQAVLCGLVALAPAVGWLLMTFGVHRLAGLSGEPAAALSPDRLIGALSALAAGALLCWVTLATVLAALARVPGAAGRAFAAAASRLAPRIIRTAVAAALGGAIAITSASVASAADAGAAPGPIPSATADPHTSLPDPGWTPAPPPAPPTRRPGEVGLVSAPGAPGRHLDDHVVVRRGDTLWAMAARHLGPDAGPAQIAREWPRWYAANRDVIGADPDRLVPGQRLEPPGERPGR